MRALVKLPWVIVALMLGALVFRGFSLSWNDYIHGDVGLYAKSAESLAHDGNLLITSDTSRPYFYDLKEKGGRILDHNPLWVFLAAPFLFHFDFSGYEALQALSYLSGALVLFLVYRLGRHMGGKRVGLLALALSALSFVLSDYSGNGSFYMFQAALYLAFILTVLDLHAWKRTALTGFIMGLGVLLNQQTIILIPALLILLIKQFHKEPLAGIQRLGVIFGIIALMFLPWGVRNYIEFKAPFYSVDMSYVWDKLGVPRQVSGNIVSFPITGKTYLALIKESTRSWLPHNLYFINRKLMLLAPVVYVFALFFIVQYLFRKKHERTENWFLPLTLVLLFHTLISALWPIAKFRYLVPLLPLIILLGSYGIFSLVKNIRAQKYLIGASVGLMALVSVLTYLATPTHTDYYDGTITTDNFGRNGELDFVQSVQSGTYIAEW